MISELLALAILLVPYSSHSYEIFSTAVSAKLPPLCNSKAKKAPCAHLLCTAIQC